MASIEATANNRKILQQHACEALKDYSPVMTWLVLDGDGDLHIIEEPQGQTEYAGTNVVIARTGGFHKARGDGAARDADGKKYKTQKAYLRDLLQEHIGGTVGLECNV